MAIREDWVTDAARELAMLHDDEPVLVSTRAVILKHCPFEPDVAYMPVPRCDGCRHWDPSPPNAYSRPSGVCKVVAIYTERGRLPLGTAEDFGCVRWEAK